MNKVYVYNETFVDLLNLICYLVKMGLKPDNIKNFDYYPSLLEEVIEINIEEKENLLEEVIKNFGDYSFKVMVHVFLSSDENKELIIYYFFINALKYRKNIVYRRDLKCVSEALRISQYVAHEGHKYKGFLRFRELKNKVLYAEIEPVNDILFIISNHFKKRLKNEYFIIKDVGRNVLSIYDKKDFVFVREEDFSISTLEVSSSEKDIQELWKSFYKTIGISDRKNDRCRMNFMPKRYWKYILEVRDEL